MLLAAAAASAQDGRGWMVGGTIGGGVGSYPGADGLGMEFGGVVEEQVSTAYGTYTVEKRAARVVPLGTSTPGALGVVPFPDSAGLGGLSFHLGYAFSRRLAVLFDVSISAGASEEAFNQALGALVVRYSPLRRVWLQAGPAGAQLTGNHQGEQSVDVRSGLGWMGAVGVVFVQRKTWELDVQARHSRVPYDGFSSSRFLVALGGGTRPAGARTTNTPGS